MRLLFPLSILALSLASVSTVFAQTAVTFASGQPKVDGTNNAIVTVTLPPGATDGKVNIVVASAVGCPATVPDTPLGSAAVATPGGDITVSNLTKPFQKTDKVCLIATYKLAGNNVQTPANPIAIDGSTSDASGSKTAPKAFRITLTDWTTANATHEPKTAPTKPVPSAPATPAPATPDPATADPATADTNAKKVNSSQSPWTELPVKEVTDNGQLDGLDFLPGKSSPPLVDAYAAESCQSQPHFADLKDAAGTYYVFNSLVLDTNNKVTTSTWQIYDPHATWWDGIKGVRKPHWGLDQVQGMRFYGARNLVVISVVVSSTAVTSISYTPQFTAASATNVSDFHALLGVLFPTGSVANTPGPPALTVLGGCVIIPVPGKYRTSSIELDASSSDGTTAAKGTFVSEANGWWDVSFAFPVNKASELTYSSANNTVAATSLSRQNLFAVADFFLPKADLRSSLAMRYIPHPFAGVAISGKPLHNLLFGISMGTSIVEVYAGAQLVYTQNLGSGLAAGSSATASQVSSATSYSFVPSASFGIKVSISSGAKLLSSGSK